VLWFVSPQLWAWKRQRLRWVRKRVSKMLVIFPFEEPFYRNRGVDATFVGHPLAALTLPAESREEFAAQHGLDPQCTWIALLPGSRAKEIRANLPTMLSMDEHLDLIWAPYEFILPVASTVSFEFLQQIVTEWKETCRYGPFTNVTLVFDARAALHHARASIIASGTATVQALTIGNPFVVVYRVSRLTYALAKRLIRYPAEIPAQPDADGDLPIAMPNLIASRRIVPELLNARFTAQNLAAALHPLLEDTPERARMVADLTEARARLLPAPQTAASLAPAQEHDPIARVCSTALELMHITSTSHK
jgi:lipid-A-disaccharide synthase